MAKMQERRKTTRWHTHCQGILKFRDKDILTKCCINDINLKGMRISLKRQLKKDSFARLKVILSSEFAIDIEAWVVWHGISGEFNTYGLFFTSISEEDKGKIYQFVRRNFPKQIDSKWREADSPKGGGEVMEDCRVFERFKANFPLRVLNLRDNKEAEAVTQDISAKGIGFKAREALAPYTPLELWMDIPDKGEPLYTRGSVVWSKKSAPQSYRIGVKLERADLMGVSRVLRSIV